MEIVAQQRQKPCERVIDGDESLDRELRVHWKSQFQKKRVPVALVVKVKFEQLPVERFDSI